MTSEDPRRKLIAEAMEAREKAENSHPAYLRGPLLRAYEALPAAVELIEELTAKVGQLHTTSRGVVARAEAAEKSLATCRDYIEKAEATIATQAKEIERLTRIDRVCVPVEHGGDSVSGDDFTGTHEEIRRWLYDHYNELWTRSEATIAEQAKEIERLRRERINIVTREDHEKRAARALRINFDD